MKRLPLSIPLARARCLTLTLRPWRALRRAAFTGLPMPTVGGPFATHARASNVFGLRTPLFQSNPLGLPTFSGAHVCQAMGIWPLRGQMFGRALRAQPHRAGACCSSVPNTASGPSSRQVPALFGTRTTPDSPAFRPLHSASLSRSGAKQQAPTRTVPLRSSGAETVETGRTARAHPNR